MPLTSPRLALVALAVLAGCATPGASDGGVPSLKLSPAALGRPLDLQQHITLRAAGHERQMDVLLEADPARVKLAIVAMGQVAARIEWKADERVEKIVGSWPARWDVSRAAQLGLHGDASFKDIVRAFIDDELGGKIPQ